MKITLFRHGGQLANWPPISVKTEELPPEAAALISAMIEKARDAPVPAGQAQPLPDAMSYTIAVEDGGAPLTLKGRDQGMSPAFRDLKDWLEKRNRGMMR